MNHAVNRSRRIVVPLVLTYAALALVGALSGRHGLDVAAVAVLLAALAFALPQPSRLSLRLAWAVLAAAMLCLTALGHARLALDTVPILVSLGIAWLFGHTLLGDREPLVSRLIRIVEGDARLDLPGVSRYARQVTRFWALLMAAQALLLTVVVFFSAPDGVLATLGVSSPLALPQRALAWYAHLGAYLLPALAMLAEYAFRRWHLRHVPHAGLRAFAARLVICWPQLLRGIASS